MTRKNDDLNTLLNELLQATAQHDKLAFSRLYKLAGPKLYAVALRILKNEASAQDCLQEAFISVWRQATSYQANRAAPMTWLTTIMRNRAIDHLRKQPHDKLKAEIEYELTMTMQQADVTVDKLAVWKCLEQLNAEQKDCVIQSYYAGLTHAELAEHKRLPLGTIKTWIRRALEQLRQCLQL